MCLNWPAGPWKYALACLGLVWCVAVGRAGENDADLRTLVEQQQQQIQELKQRLDAQGNAGVQAAKAAPDGNNAAAAAPVDNGRVVIDDAQIKQIIADYLKENPGAGMPPGVQTGYSSATGFAIRSTQNPEYANWYDEGGIPFELRIRGRVQIPWFGYKVTDNINHIIPGQGTFVYPTVTQSSTSANGGRLSGNGNNTGNPIGIVGANSTGDFNQIEVKRLRLIWEGVAFDPNFRYHFELEASTRGQADVVPPFGPMVGDVGGGATNGGLADNAVRLHAAYCAYDFHPCCVWPGCGPDCPPGATAYAPTFTIIGGKLKPFMSYEEVLGSANAQFCDFGMASAFFDADDDNLLNWWGVQYRALQDRLFATAGMTNGNESNAPNLSMDDHKGLNAGFWYDFGGTWNEQRKAYDLYGDCQADIDYSCKPVVRVGFMSNFVWNDRRSEFGAQELNREKVAWAGPGGTVMDSQLDGASVTGANGLPFWMDKNDQYTYEAFISGKWRGFSFTNDWFFRYYDNFQGTHNATGFDNPILYTAVNPFNIINSNANNLKAPGNEVGLFNVGSMMDFGMTLQVGYFIIPKKAEICARWGMIDGQSGDFLGNGTFHNGPVMFGETIVVPGTVGKVSTLNYAGTLTKAGGLQTVVFNDAFREFHQSNELQLGFNYYWRRQQLKWQSDIGYYMGGNPASGFQAASTWIPGVDGWLLRTQLTFMF
jgi:hypothetical protein